MKISIFGGYTDKHMRIQGKEWIETYKLQYHLRVNNWYDFINYIKQYKDKAEFK